MHTGSHWYCNLSRAYIQCAVSKGAIYSEY
jgi:hypothetical protein